MLNTLANKHCTLSRVTNPGLPSWLLAYEKIVQGVHIGIIGAVLKDTPTIVTPAGVAGLTFLDEATEINRYARELKLQGVHTIIVTIHQGTFQTSSGGVSRTALPSS